jgi:hypothetical protein
LEFGISGSSPSPSSDLVPSKYCKSDSVSDTRSAKEFKEVVPSPPLIASI